MAKRLTERLEPLVVSKLTAQGRYPDGGGLWLQIGLSGSKSWLLIFKTGGKQHWMGLGPYPDVSLKDARELARQHRATLRSGVNPLEAKRAAKEAKREADASRITFDVAAERFIAAHRPGWTNSKNVQQWQNTLATYASPVIGNLPVSAVTVGHILRILETDDLWNQKPETASRVRGRIERVMDWAKGRGYRTGDNPAAWKGNLSAQLPASSKLKDVEHHPALPVDDMPAFMSELRHRDGVGARALEFCVLTAARTGEVIGATWQEVDMKAGTWTIPASRMKGGREHKVPLSGRTLEILRGLNPPSAVDSNPKRASDFVFPGGTGKGLSNAAMLKLMKAMRPGFTPHGTARSTFRDWASERTSTAREVVEMSLAHAIGDKVEAAYRRGDLFEKRKKLMWAWESFCAKEFLNGGAMFALVQLPARAA